MNDHYLYFLYSDLQRAARENMEAKISRQFIPGVVIVNGVEYEFTEISYTNKNIYIDCKVVAEGLKSTMKYKDISYAPTWNLI